MTLKQKLIADYEAKVKHPLKVKEYQEGKYVHADFLNYLIQDILEDVIMFNLKKSLALLDLSDVGEEVLNHVDNSDNKKESIKLP